MHIHIHIQQQLFIMVLARLAYIHSILMQKNVVCASVRTQAIEQANDRASVWICVQR